MSTPAPTCNRRNPSRSTSRRGDVGSAYELRWFTLFSTPLLTSDYLNPVGSSVDNQRTITYLFNPSESTISVSASCTGCPGVGSPLTIAAKGGVSFASPLSQAVRFQSVGAVPFVAVGAGGSQSGALPGSTGDGSATFDWGFGLVPTSLLTTKAVLGWAPGNSANPPSATVGDRDDDPVWISTLGDTDLFIDFDGNPATGALTAGSCDGNYDELRPVLAYTSNRIIDVDGDMTGARIFTCNGVKLAGAWGEDPANAATGAPGYDAGYAMIPSTAMIVDKTAGTAIDANGDGRIGPGDTLEYVVSIADAGALAFTNIKINDALPAATTYVPNSTTYAVGEGAPSPFADDVVPPAATAYPFDGVGADVAQINPGTTVHLRYRVQINAPFPAGTTILNSVTVAASEGGRGRHDRHPVEGRGPVAVEDGDIDADVPRTERDVSAHRDERRSRRSRRRPGPRRAPSWSDVRQQHAEPGQLRLGHWCVGRRHDSERSERDVGHHRNRRRPVGDEHRPGERIGCSRPRLHPGQLGRGRGRSSVRHRQRPPSRRRVVDEGPRLGARLGRQHDIHADRRERWTEHGDGGGRDRLSTRRSNLRQRDPADERGCRRDVRRWLRYVDGPDVVGRRAGRLQRRVQHPRRPLGQLRAGHLGERERPRFGPDAPPLSAGNPPDQDDEAVAGFPASGDISVTNVVSAPPSYVGDQATFVVTVTNGGPTNTTGAMVVDQLPSGLVFVSATPSVGTYDSGTGLWNIGPMANGDVQTLTLVARVTTAGTLSTTAELTASTASDVDSTPNNHVISEDDQQTNSVVTTGASLGDTVWYDVDLDTIQDAGDPGLAGVSVTATWVGPNGTPGDLDDIAYATTTDLAGSWSLTGLPHGNYSVAVNPASLPSGITVATSDLDGSAQPERRRGDVGRWRVPH